MIKSRYPYFLAGEPVFANEDLHVHNKYTGEVVSRVARANSDTVREAIDHASNAAEAMRALKPYERKAILQHCIQAFKDRREELAQALCIEAGKAIQHSRGEVTRLIDTFEIAAEEAVRITGEVMPLEISARARGYSGMWKRVPIGVCGLITPFNFPLNLVAHKVAPAIAAGCPFVLKPASSTPLGALIIAEILAETDLPKGAFSVLPCSGSEASPLVDDERVKFLSFTGSPEVGWGLKERATKKKVSLELGGNAACIVDADTDLNDAIERIKIGAFYQSGQSCISVQRILVHTSLYDAFRDAFVDAAQSLTMGDPSHEDTFLGPMISEDEAERVEEWVQEAVDAGATILCGGTRDKAMFSATVLENVPRDVRMYREEVFGPVALITPFEDFDAALKEVNDSAYGLQAGVFTRDIYRAHKAWDTLEVGGVVIGDIPSWRVDHMPYGGVKDSGFGREGLKFAMEEMSEIRLMVLRDPSES